MKDYENYDALGLAELVKRGETSAEALLEAAISRTEARDGTIGAIVIRMFEQARKAIATGVPGGPFEGVPFLLKDLHLAWPGVILSNGSKLFADYIPEIESE
jgi:amidase